jgi:hypothetical protein
MKICFDAATNRCYSRSVKKFLFRLVAIVALGTAWLVVTPNALAQAKYFDPPTAAATSTAAAATLNTESGTITTETLTTAAQASYTFTLTDNLIAASSIIFAVVDKGTATTGGLVQAYTTPAAGSAVIVFQNPGSAAVNGTVKIRFLVITK